MPAPQGRVFPREAWSEDLVDPNSAVEVLQPLLAEITELDVEQLLELVFEQADRGLREQDLAPVAERADPGRAVNCEADVPFADELRGAGMDPDPDSKLRLRRPLVLAERSLRAQRREHGISGPGKRDEEGVALRVDLAATVPSKGLPHQPLMVGDHRRIALA